MIQGKTWNNVNELMNGGNVSKKNTEVDKLITNNDGVERTVKTEKDIAESFNDFFCEHWPKVSS